MIQPRNQLALRPNYVIEKAYIYKNFEDAKDPEGDGSLDPIIHFITRHAFFV